MKLDTLGQLHAEQARNTVTDATPPPIEAIVASRRAGRLVAALAWTAAAAAVVVAVLVASPAPDLTPTALIPTNGDSTTTTNASTTTMVPPPGTWNPILATTRPKPAPPAATCPPGTDPNATLDIDADVLITPMPVTGGVTDPNDPQIARRAGVIERLDRAEITVTAAAVEMGVSTTTVRKWLANHRGGRPDPVAVRRAMVERLATEHGAAAYAKHHRRDGLRERQSQPQVSEILTQRTRRHIE